MSFARRRFLQLIAVAAAGAAYPQLASALDYPTRSVRLIVPYAAGGATDIIGRLMAQWLTERLGQRFLVENRPGAGTNVGTEAAVRAPPNGYTLFLADAASAINATLYDKLNFVFLRDMAPVAGIVSLPYVLLVHPSVPAQTVGDLVVYTGANPGKINMASAGNGSPSQLRASCSR
jgi:tripartite-type tricarboxylate transporter receptor subunit TctC